MFALQNLGLRSAQCRVTQCNECKHWEDYLFPLYMFFWDGIWLHHLENILLLYKKTSMEIWSSASLQRMSNAKVCVCKAGMSCLLRGCCALLGSLCGVCLEMVDPSPDISAFSWEQPLQNLRHPEWLSKDLALKRCSCSTARRWMNLSAAHAGDPKAEPLFLWRCSSPPFFAPCLTCSHCFPVQEHPEGICRCLHWGSIQPSNTQLVPCRCVAASHSHPLQLSGAPGNCSFCHDWYGNRWIKAICLLNTCKHISLSDTLPHAKLDKERARSAECHVLKIHWGKLKCLICQNSSIFISMSKKETGETKRSFFQESWEEGRCCLGCRLVRHLGKTWHALQDMCCVLVNPVIFSSLRVSLVLITHWSTDPTPSYYRSCSP